jgi:hypothetical protein
MAFSSIFMGYYVLSVYKIFGTSIGGEIADDNFLTQVGIATSIGGSLRLVWSSLLDIKGASFKLVYGVLLVMQIVLGLTVFWAAEQGKITFLAWMTLMVFTEGGHFTLVPNAIKTIFGK